MQARRVIGCALLSAVIVPVFSHDSNSSYITGRNGRALAKKMGAIEQSVVASTELIRSL
jgi:hypothetical protein